MQERTNEDRANSAVQALKVYYNATRFERAIDYAHPEDVRDAAGDLMCDLLHFLHQNGANPKEYHERAVDHFEEEVEEAKFYDCSECGRNMYPHGQPHTAECPSALEQDREEGQDV